MITFLYVVGGIIGVIVGFFVLMFCWGNYLSSQERKNAEKNYDKAYKEYTNKKLPEALITLANAFYVPPDEKYSKQDASTALRVIKLLETIIEELGVHEAFTTDLKKSLESASLEGGIISKEITDPVEKILGKLKYNEVEPDEIAMVLNQTSDKGEEKIEEGFYKADMPSTEGFTKKEYSYGINKGGLVIFLFCMGMAFAGLVLFMYYSNITIIDLFQDEENSFQLSIAGLMVILFVFFIKIYKTTKKINHKFVITEEGITFPPKPIFKKIITIPFDQIKSVRKFSGRGVKTINIKAEVGRFSFLEGNFETVKIYNEVHDLIKESIAKNLKKA
jgi:hypothetical protein